MQLASSGPIPDGLLATIALRNENSRLGVPSSEAALHLGHDRSKSEIVLGIEAADTTTRVRSSDTGKERDTESGNDYFGARYYASSMGRWLSPDWSAKEEPVPYAKLDDPQTLNLYSYVGNNPLVHADADGHVAGVDDAVEGIVVVGVLGAFALEAVAQYYNHSPEAQRSLNGAMNAAGQGISNGVQTIKNKLSNVFNSDKKPGTKGKPDHQQTVKEEAEKIGGKPEVPIATPGGHKEGRVGDAVAKDGDGKVTAVTQVYRPTPAGNIPLREQKAAQDIENATGVKPNMVPVRPLPQQ